ncbi:probable UDP-glucosyl transferase 73B6 [Typha angustifolia]|uniref:probable UDP-glucosyl transferase 73B6 n=1 Tax=Typha angustifolia TaxID=59011 RepID=UPI003C2B7F32
MHTYNYHHQLMGSESNRAHLLFFPFLAVGHVLPMVDMAKLFASRGVRASVVTTQSNAASIESAIGSSAVDLWVLQAGLPDGSDYFAAFPDLETTVQFLAAATPKLQGPFHRLLLELRPDAVVTDSFLPWTQTVAESLNIPRLVFHGTSFFALCGIESQLALILLTDANTNINTDTVILPGLPHRIEMLRSQFPVMTKNSNAFNELLDAIAKTEPRSYGVIVNSFYELETDYAAHYRNVLGRNAWHVGPVSICNQEMDSRKYLRGGQKNAIDQNECLTWLNRKQPRSVVYVSFGSLYQFSEAQLREIALGLAKSNVSFIWVIRGCENDDWVPENFVDRIRERGLVLRGWAPQTLILNHESIGGFVTHCGWNSSLEAISAGVPMATWPLFAEQFLNERLLVEVVRIGVPIGSEKFALAPEDRPVVGSGKVEMAIRRLMGEEEEAEERRRRAEELGEMAKKAVEVGGSSYADVGRLIKELIDRRIQV